MIHPKELYTTCALFGLLLSGLDDDEEVAERAEAIADLIWRRQCAPQGEGLDV